MKYGFLRETEQSAIKAGLDKTFGLHRTGLDTYLKVIFPEINDWIHDKPLGKVNNISYRMRPDYRSETLKIIIEFDGLQHYTNPDKIIDDFKKIRVYQSLGYKVVRIPYFIQLTKNNIKQLFNITVENDLFSKEIPSLYGLCTPSYLCLLGIMRMAAEFKQYEREYFELNINYMKEKEFYTSGWQLLMKFYKNKDITLQMFYNDNFINNKVDIYKFI